MDSEDIQRQVAEFRRAYMYDPDFVDRRYELPSVAELVALPGVVGVVRYIEFPSFEPERLFTLLYRPAVIEVSVVVGASPLWYSTPALYEEDDTGEFEVEDGEPFEQAHARRQSAVVNLPSEVCPLLLRTWASVRSAATGAGDCSTDSFDGISYRHRVADPGFHVLADWWNPDRSEHAPQVALIEAYVTLLRSVSLYPE
jgi:hypothetical protein